MERQLWLEAIFTYKKSSVWYQKFHPSRCKHRESFKLSSLLWGMIAVLILMLDTNTMPPILWWLRLNIFFDEGRCLYKDNWYSSMEFVFLTAIWLPLGQLSTIIEGKPHALHVNHQVPRWARKTWDRWVKVLKNGPSKIYGRQSLKTLKWHGLLRRTISLP